MDSSVCGAQRSGSVLNPFQLISKTQSKVLQKQCCVRDIIVLLKNLPRILNFL